MTTPRRDIDNPMIGQIVTPQRWGLKMDPKKIWCADNGMYSGDIKPAYFLSWLERVSIYRSTCVFACAPDVVANAVATLDYFRWYSWRIKSLGYPVALVGQDGLESLKFPPSHAYDALFIGGTTAWKMSEGSEYCIKKAQRDNKWIHVGRVNSDKRYKYFQLLGVNSVDGTYVIYSPKRNLNDLDRWTSQSPLFQM